jgi:hypothetical protein
MTEKSSRQQVGDVYIEGNFDYATVISIRMGKSFVMQEFDNSKEFLKPTDEPTDARTRALAWVLAGEKIPATA